GRVRKIRTPHHLAYPLRGIIDHNGELVGWRAVVAVHDEVVHLFLTASEKSVPEGNPGSLRTHPQRRRASWGLALGATVRPRQMPGYRSEAGMLCGADAAARISARVQ